MSGAAQLREASSWPAGRDAWLRALYSAKGLSDGAKVLGGFLANVGVDRRTGETGLSWKALGRMAGGKSERTFRRHAAELVATGFLVVEHHGPGRCEHVLRLVPPPAGPRGGVVEMGGRP